jgi:AcrR family transcriptional regulator
MATRTPSLIKSHTGGRRTRERILEAASNVLADRGYHETNVEEIVNRSGTSKGGFYFHFPSKEQMVMALVGQLGDKLVRKVERSMGNERRPAYRLTIAVDTLMQTFANRRKLARILLINVAGQGKSMDRKFMPVRHGFANLIRSELDGAVAAGLIEPLNTTLASQVWLGAFHEVLLEWLIADSPPPVPGIIPELTTMLFRSAGFHSEQLPAVMQSK